MWNWNLFVAEKKPSETPPTVNPTDSTTTTSSGTEYLQHLKTTQNNLDKFTNALSTIHSSVKSLLENSSSIDNRIQEVHKTLDSQIEALHNQMKVEETRIGSITQVKQGGGRSRKTNRRRSKTNRRRRKH